MPDVTNKNYEELLSMRSGQVAGTVGWLQIDAEIRRIQQDTNNTQIANLIGEVRTLKEITKDNTETSVRNSKSDNNLAKTAIWIAVASLIVQVIFSAHLKFECAYSSVSTDAPGITRYSGCRRTLDIGLFGTYTFRAKDFSN